MTRTICTVGQQTEYTLICSRNRTSFLLQALPQGKIRLYAPAGCSLREADRLVRQNLDRIASAHEAMAAALQVLPNSLLYEGRRLMIRLHSAGTSHITVSESELNVQTPYRDNREISAQIKRWLIKRALNEIRVYLDKWSPTVGISYGRVTVREQRTRWGSCSSRHNLNFNWKLIMAPRGAMEYVVVHELCHLIHLNHSRRFWEEVSERLPDYGIWKKWLKAHGQELHFP